MAAPRTRFDTADVPLGGGETVRVGLEFDADGHPVYLHLALGLGTGREWQECTEAGFTIPADRMADLVRALSGFVDAAGAS